MAVEIMPIRARQVALSTLATSTAQILNSAAITAAFLAKHLRGQWVLEASDAFDYILVGISRGDATVAEIKTALEQNLTERDAPDSAASRQVLWETVRTLYTNVNVDDPMVEIDVTLGGGKGIPFDRDDGWALFAYNAGNNNQVAGALLSFHGYFTGVFL